MVSKLCTADAMLKTKEENKNVLVATATTPVLSWYESCMVETVTPERKVAIVVMFKYQKVLFFCAERIVCIP